MRNVENSPVHKRTTYVRVGNLAKIQRNGTLTFTVPNSNSLTFQARQVDAQSERDFVWTGKSTDGLYQAIFICKEGKLSGSFESQQGNYQLYAIEAGTSMLMEVDLSEIGECKSAGEEKAQGPVKLSGARQELCREATRVLILYTHAAELLVPDINQLADLCIQQYNSALNNSGMGNQITNTLVRAEVAFIDFTETANPTNDAASISQRTDAQNLRNQHRADIVVTLTGNSYQGSFGSVVSDIPATNNTAYAVVIATQASLAGAYTFTHETGQLFGGRHDINYDPNGPAYAHGYQLPGQISGQTVRTLMSVRSAGDLSRILYFSNPNVSFNGVPTGTVASNDVARRIGEVSASIVNFRQSASSSYFGYIDGTSSVYNTGNYQYEIAYQCIRPVSFNWQVSRDGFTFGSSIGDSEAIQPYITSADNGLYYLRCQVTLPSGEIQNPTKYVSVNICDGCRVGRDIAGEAYPLQLSTSPNPTAASAIRVNFTLPQETPVSLVLTDARAVIIKAVELGTLTPGSHQRQLDVAGLNPGVYVVSLQAGSQKQSQKIAIAK